MKKTLMLLCAVTLVFGMLGTAMATTFTLDSYTVNFRDQDPGLVLYANNILSEPSTADLTVGQSYTFDLFSIGTTEHYVNWDDRAEYAISVDFDFAAPSDINESIVGESDGHWRMVGDDFGTVDWNNPATFSYGNGGLFTIALSDVSFGTPGSATVTATLDFVSDSAPVPEPATILLMGAGLLGLVGYKRKRFSKKS